MLLMKFIPKIHSIIYEKNQKKMKSVDVFSELTFDTVQQRNINSILEEHLSISQKKGLEDLIQVGAEAFTDSVL